MKSKQWALKASLWVVSAALLAGCAATTFVKADGSTDEPVWPQWDKTTFNQQRGIFPDPSSLSQVKPGMTKDQLYYLLGRPHYGEAWRPVEWNYLFHFHTPNRGDNGVSTCQFKVLFDKNMIARHFYWNAVNPENGNCPPSAAPTPPKRYTLGADALFAFNRSDLNNMNAQGRKELDKLLLDLKKINQLNKVSVTGHTDYLGSDNYNLNLSQRRAESVRQYLIAGGIPASKIRAVGMGERQPIKTCSATANRAALIACLQPNRRVEIQVESNAGSR